MTHRLMIQGVFLSTVVSMFAKVSMVGNTGRNGRRCKRDVYGLPPYCKTAVTVKMAGLLSYIRPVDEALASGPDETFAHSVLIAYTAWTGLSHIAGFRNTGLTCFSSFVHSSQFQGKSQCRNNYC